MKKIAILILSILCLCSTTFAANTNNNSVKYDPQKIIVEMAYQCEHALHTPAFSKCIEHENAKDYCTCGQDMQMSAGCVGCDVSQIQQVINSYKKSDQFKQYANFVVQISKDQIQ